MKKIGLIIASLALLASCGSNPQTPDKAVADQPSESLQEVARKAYVYSYPMLEQIKTINGMKKVMGLGHNKFTWTPNLPWESVGMPIVAPNLTSMTGGFLVDLTNGPVTIEIPEAKDRYIVIQNVDGFTHNFNYQGTVSTGGAAGRYTYHLSGQTLPEEPGTAVEVETPFAMLVIRMDITDESELPRIHEIQSGFRVVSAPEAGTYPIYDEAKAGSPEFVDYINASITGVPIGEDALYKQFAAIGIGAEVTLSDEQRAQVQSGIADALKDIGENAKSFALGNGYIGATEAFGNRAFMGDRYLDRASGAQFGLWGNSKSEANYFLLKFEGEGTITFSKDELPPISDVGFWSVTAHDEDVMVKKNEAESYVLTMNQVKPADDGSVTFHFTSKKRGENWLYVPGGPGVLILRVYAADDAKIGTYVPPKWVPVSE